jgi:general secretion pathway protein G
MSNCDCAIEVEESEQLPPRAVHSAHSPYREPSLHRMRTGGFTLLELLVVLAIIGLLGALIGPQLFERLEGSKVVTAQTQVRMLKTALDTMRLDIGRYPTVEEGLNLLVASPSEAALRARWRGPYLEGAVPLDPWGNPYQYNPTGRDLNAITLYSYGPTGKPGGEMVGYLPSS